MRQQGCLGPLTVDDEVDQEPVLVEVAGSRFVVSRDLQTEAAVAVRLVPQVVEEPDQDVVVRGAIDGPMQLAVSDECCLASTGG